jgi:hypothetical protein
MADIQGMLLRKNKLNKPGLRANLYKEINREGGIGLLYDCYTIALPS